MHRFFDNTPQQDVKPDGYTELSALIAVKVDTIKKWIKETTDRYIYRVPKQMQEEKDDVINNDDPYYKNPEYYKVDLIPTPESKNDLNFIKLMTKEPGIDTLMNSSILYGIGCGNEHRFINLEIFIASYHQRGLIDLIKYLFKLGFRNETTNKLKDNLRLVIDYNDLTYIKHIAFFIDVEKKLESLKYSVEGTSRWSPFFYHSKIKLEKDMDYSKKRNLLQYDNELDYTPKSELVITGYLKEIYVNKNIPPDEIVQLCLKFYSFICNYYKYMLTNNNNNVINILSIKTGKKYILNLQDTTSTLQKPFASSLNSVKDRKIHYANDIKCIVREIKLPKWIKQDDKYGNKIKINDDNISVIFLSSGKCILYNPYSSVKDNNGKNIITAYLIKINDWPNRYGYGSGVNDVVYNNYKHCLLSLDHRKIKSYDFEQNKYEQLILQTNDSRYSGAAMCCFDNERKFLISGSRNQHCFTDSTCGCQVLRSVEYGSFDDIDNYSNIVNDDINMTPLEKKRRLRKLRRGVKCKYVSSMSLIRKNHAMIYQKELKKAIVGGGEGRINNHTIDLFDLQNNKWKLIKVRTGNAYAKTPSLWYDNQNPYIVYIADIQKHCSEFLDLREQIKWYNYDKISKLSSAVKNHQNVWMV